MEKSFAALPLLESPTSSQATNMRKLVRCKQTKAFLAEDGTWTHEIQQALALPDYLVPKAIRAQCKSGELELYYSFNVLRECQYDFSMSVL